MRKIIQLSKDTIDDNNDIRESITLKFKQAGRKKNILQLYSNQLDVARQVLECFHKDRKIVSILIVAHTQSGKTGIMLAIIKIIAIDLDIVPIENIYIITGLSSTDWLAQMKKEFPSEFFSRIFHRNDLLKVFNEQIKTKKNVLIMMDEVQLASKPGQTIDKCFNDFGLKKLYENDIKIVEFSATPDGTLYDFYEDEWESAYKIKLAKPGEGYFGSFDYLEQKRVRQFKDLCGYDETTGLTDPKVLDNIREIADCFGSFTTPKYHFVRTRPGIYGQKTQDNFRGIFGDNFDYNNYDGKRIEIENINNLLHVLPLKHTFVFIKNLLRCSNFLQEKKHIGIMYDLFTKSKSGPSNSVINQSLLGRATGYNVNNETIIWTDIDSIVIYKELWDAKFSKEARIKWKSATTKNKGGRTVSRGTFNGTIPDVVKTPLQDLFIRDHSGIFFTYDEAEKFGKLHFKSYNRKNYKTNNEGFKLQTISDGPCVCSLAEVLKLTEPDTAIFSNLPRASEELLPNIGDTSHRTYVCYENMNDKSTERFVIIWAKRISK